MSIKKLIEVALPLEKINKESAREKSIRHGHPSTLHMWWARRPLAAARAVIWSSLVDDPSSHPELFPTVEAQNVERERLFNILEDLVVWENSNNEEVLNKAKAEIKKYNPVLPEFLDPFAGGGALPLEAQRLGLVAHAHDLNPVAVMINKAMLEIPPKFANMPPINPEAREKIGAETAWKGAAGLAEDVRYYGEMLKKLAFDKIGCLYPRYECADGKSYTVAAWLWAHTVVCPNPGCGCHTPLVKSFYVNRQKKVSVRPSIVNGNVSYSMCDGEDAYPATVSRSGVTCIKCGQPIELRSIRQQGKCDVHNDVMIGIVGERNPGRIYLACDEKHQQIALNCQKSDILDTDIPRKALGFSVQSYGMLKHRDLFTNRQLIMLETLSKCLATIKDTMEQDLKVDGHHSYDYCSAVSTYLTFVIDKVADRNSILCSWDNTRDGIRSTFGLPVLSMTWDYAEANPFSNSSGCYDNMLSWVLKCLKNFQPMVCAETSQFNAEEDCGLRNLLVSTDPPYYDNIGYADLSDFFYVWMRNNLKELYPELFSTMLVPKAEELIANPFKFDGNKEKAKEFFENGMYRTCCQIYKYTHDDLPVTIYYAYKQRDANSSDNTSASTGWETMLTAIVRAGFVITGTWPMRTELANRARSHGSNALASSIVLVCRKRPQDAGICTKKNFINEMRRELVFALDKLQESNIAPVDLAQAAIGPGMGIYSKYSKVLEADGKEMSVRSALQIINQELDSYFNAQDSDLDRESRFCIDLYSQFAFNEVKYGDALTLARAKNTSPEAVAAKGVLEAKQGSVHLLERKNINFAEHREELMIWKLAQELTYAMETGGVNACAKVAADNVEMRVESAKSLAYRLYTIAERKGWNDEAFAYNTLITSWQEIEVRAMEYRSSKPVQQELF